MATLRLVLIGTTGTGKSSTGNTLVGGTENAFICEATRQSVTIECSVAEVERFGTKLVVVDTPGIFDTAMSEEDLKVQLMECTQLACPGVHAFLFIMKIGDRDINRRDQKSFDLMRKMLGKEFLSYTIVVFTGKETLDVNKQDLNDFISKLPSACKKFINSCRGGFLAISNIVFREDATEQIIDKVNILVEQNGGSDRYYTNVLCDAQNQEINRRMEKILEKNNNIQNQIRHAQIEKQTLEACFEDSNPTDDQRKQHERIENKISNLRGKLVDRKAARLSAHRAIQRAQTVKRVIVAGSVGVAAVAAVAVGAAAVANPAGAVATAAVVTSALTKRF